MQSAELPRYRQTEPTVTLAGGRCVVGVGKQRLPVSGRQPMAGFSLSGNWGRPGSDSLWARALYIEDEQTGERAVVCVLDLLSSSLGLLHEVHLALGAGSKLHGRVILCGTHTHSAPGRFFGNRFYDTLAQRGFWGYSRSLTRDFAGAIAEACRAAAASAVSGSLAVHSQLVWGPAGNRSLQAHLAGRKDREAPAPVAPAPQGTDVFRSAVDPRLTVLCARDANDGLLGVFGWYGCHATALGRKTRQFDRDWPGVAVTLAEAELGCLCAVGAGPGGDASPLPSEVYELSLTRRADQAKLVESYQGPQLAKNIGTPLGQALTAVARGARAEPTEPLPVTFSSGLFEVTARGSLPRWQFGVPALGGSEDGGPTVPFYDFFYQFVSEGFVNNTGPQRPKAPALGFVQAQTLGLLEVARIHPWYRLRLGQHMICTVPGEPTATAACVLEDSAIADMRASSASVVGYAGDYVGYFTTAAEYGLQHYEGASTLYGPKSLEWYRDQLMGPDRPVPARGSDPSLRDGAVPQRHIERLTQTAHELKSARAGTVSVLFAVPQNQVPSHVGLSQGAAKVSGVLRPFPNLDPDAPQQHDAYVAVFDLVGSGVSVRQIAECQLQYQLQGNAHQQPIVPHGTAERKGRLPSSMNQARVRLAWIRRTFLGLMLLLGALGLCTACPWLLLPLLGWPAAPFDLLMTFELGLSFWLLAINFGYAKNSRDLTALSGYAFAGSALAVVVALVFVFQGGPHLGSMIAGSAAAAMLWLGFRVSNARGGQRNPSPQYWEFWKPLFWVSWLTLLGGIVLLIFPSQIATCVGIQSPRAALWLRAFAGGFLVNTVSMWQCRYTRDLRVVRGQLLGSVFFDTLTLGAFALAVATGIFNPRGLVLLLPFAYIAMTFPRIATRARRRENVDFRRPRTTRELCRLVRDAVVHRLVLRVLGSGHSVPGAVFDREPGPRPIRPSSSPDVFVSLEHFDQVLDVDRDLRQLTVQAGMHLGEDPKDPHSVTNNLLLHLKELGWAIGDLGGITHQTIGGFLATGASGGSLRHALFDNVVAIRYVDGEGRVNDARRGDAMFDAVSVSMGLIGIVTEVTFRCEPRYQVRGREFAASVVEGRVKLPTGGFSGNGAPPELIELTSPGADGLAAYLQRVDFCRILWWPQENISKMVIWEAFKTSDIPTEERPYRPDSGFAQWFAGKVLMLLGWSYGGGVRRVWGRLIRRHLLPSIVDKFLPNPQKEFHAGWDVNLPMDTHVDDALLPVEFTELWFPLESTAEVMQVLLEMYRDPDTAGAFTVELYVAGCTDSWLSPAYQRDCFRVDIFWFQRNAGDPVLEYFPRFYERLARLQFRPHWGKYLPQPGSAQGVSYLAAAYPKWDAFMQARAASDPHGVLLSQYWRRHLGL